MHFKTFTSHHMGDTAAPTHLAIDETIIARTRIIVSFLQVSTPKALLLNAALLLLRRVETLRFRLPTLAIPLEDNDMYAFLRRVLHHQNAAAEKVVAPRVQAQHP